MGFHASHELKTTTRRRKLSTAVRTIIYSHANCLRIVYFIKNKRVDLFVLFVSQSNLNVSSTCYVFTLKNSYSK